MVEISPRGKCLLDAEHRLYQRAVRREVAFWGNSSATQVLSSIENRPIVLAYRNRIIAGIDSSLYDDWMNILAVHYPVRRYGISLGSGTGLAERALLRRNFVAKLDTIDLAHPDDNARSHEVNPIYRDLNFAEFTPETYDFVFCHGVLHHIINLEWLVHQIWRTLTSDGIVVVYEYIGENRWQWTDQRIDYLNSQFRTEFGDHKFEDFIISRPNLWEMSSFESIRSAELLPALMQQFGCSTKLEVQFGGALYPILNSLSRLKHYSEVDINRLLRFAVTLDEKVTHDKIVQPCLLFGIYARGDGALSPSDVRTWSEAEIRFQLDERLHMPLSLRMVDALRGIQPLRITYKKAKALLLDLIHFADKQEKAE